MTAAPDESPWCRWRTPVVRDLAWALASPPLLLAPTPSVEWLDAAWGERAWQASEDWLAALDRDPSVLSAALGRRPGRLGGYFEALLACWLAWPGNPLFRLVRHGLPVRVGKRTVGELDFLVEDRLTGELQHWEVAVKFYLGIAPGGAHADWIGPGQRDRLDLKVDHLMRHQLPLSQLPEGLGALSEAGLERPRPICLLRGRLFYPHGARHNDWEPANAAPDHLRGWWMPLPAFAHHYAAEAVAWIRLPREHWLAPVASPPVRIGEALTAQQLVETLEAAADNRAAAVVGLVDGQEVSRGFITPPQWPWNPESA
ncbi:MAG: hypothetical protein K0S46_450 [Moraxellaceae bacterium]|nr:hypothetical protein [Moraxellaceae bacterium]